MALGYDRLNSCVLRCLTAASDAHCCLLQEHELNSHGGHSQLQLYTPGTHYHDIRSCHTVHSFKNTSKHNCSAITPIMVISHPLSASSIYYDPWHPPYSIYMPDRLSPQSLSKFSLVYCGDQNSNLME